MQYIANILFAILNSSILQLLKKFQFPYFSTFQGPESSLRSPGGPGGLGLSQARPGPARAPRLSFSAGRWPAILYCCSDTKESFFVNKIPRDMTLRGDGGDFESYGA